MYLVPFQTIIFRTTDYTCLASSSISVLILKKYKEIYLTTRFFCTDRENINGKYYILGTDLSFFLVGLLPSGRRRGTH